MRFTSAAWSLTCAVMLTGCFGGDVSIVKESRLQGWPQFTVGQLLDKRKACSSIEWKSFKDTRDRQVVEYTCEVAAGKDFLQRLASSYIEETRAKLQSDYYDESEYAERDTRVLGTARENLQFQVEEIDNRQASIVELQSDVTRIKQVTLSTCQDVDVSKFSRKLSAHMQSFKSECVQAVRNNDQSHLEIFKREIVKVAENSILSHEYEIRDLKIKIEHQTLDIEKKLAYYEEQKNIRKEHEIKRHNEAQAKLIALERHWQGFKTVQEVSQWVIQDKEPVYLASRIDLMLADKTIEQPVVARVVFDQASKDESGLTSAYESILRDMWNQYPVKP